MYEKHNKNIIIIIIIITKQIFKYVNLNLILPSIKDVLKLLKQNNHITQTVA
jgi:hypothetical protein